MTHYALAVLALLYSPDRTRSAAEAAGFKDVQIIGPAFFACGREYTFSTKFTATNANGVRVEGVACCGWFMGCSLRF